MNIAIAGGGIVGLMTAWRLSRAGHRVTVFDPGPQRSAAAVAAGRLAPIVELEFGEEELFEFGAAAGHRWSATAAELQTDSGIDPGFDDGGMLMVARDRDDMTVLDRMARHRERLSLDVERLSGRALRRVEPALGPRVRGGLVVASDHAVDPRAVLAGLSAACRSRGVVTVPEPVVSTTGRSVRTPSGALDADAVVVAAGAWAGRIDIDGYGRLPISPVKGQILRFRFDSSVIAPTRSIDGLSCYLVPRRSGELVLGASVEHKGFDLDVTAGAVHQLLDRGRELVPALDEMAMCESAVGFRPASPDNAPLLGPIGVGGPLVAAGLYRHGVLLAPLVADLIVDAVDGGADLDRWERFAADRFAATSADEGDAVKLSGNEVKP